MLKANSLICIISFIISSQCFFISDVFAYWTAPEKYLEDVTSESNTFMRCSQFSLGDRSLWLDKVNVNLEGEAKVLWWNVCVCSNEFREYRHGLAEDGTSNICKAYEFDRNNEDVCVCEDFGGSGFDGRLKDAEFSFKSTKSKKKGIFISAEEQNREHDKTIVVLVYYKVFDSLESAIKKPQVITTTGYHWTSNYEENDKEVTVDKTVSNYFFCGDNMIQSEYEKCDDGANNGTEGFCDNNCQKRIPSK